MIPGADADTRRGYARAMAPHRRLAQRVTAVGVVIAAAAAVLAVVIGSQSGKPTARPEAATASAPQPRPAVHRHRRTRPLPPAPAQVRGDAARQMAVPILMYHVVGNRPPTAPYPELWVTPTTFAA